MSSIHLILGSHNSQILNLPEADQETQYDGAIKPFLKVLYNRRDTRFTLYYSGLLLEWLEKHHSEFVDVLTEMVKRKQVELLGGAFYEPFLPLVPKTDRIGQIERMTTYLRKCFGRRPRGGWLPEGVWDQRIAASLNTGGLDYILLRASTFLKENEEHRFRAVLTEDQGKTLTVLPVANRLSDTMFQRDPQEMLTYLRTLRDTAVDLEEVPVIALLFDGVALGRTGGGPDQFIPWYEEFLDQVAANRDWINVDTPGRILQGVLPRERCYAPDTTYSALMDWLPPGTPSEDGRDSVNGAVSGSFRAVMEIYPESARLYARMQHTHVLVNQIRGDKYRKMTAREELWRGQNHFAYWLNTSGGVYHANLRKAVYGALIEAEKTTRERGVFIPAMSRIDVDLDGREEILYQGNEINAYLHRFGARLFELDLISRTWNYLDTFQRRRESFHDDAAMAAGYDSWPRAAFVDHLITPDLTASEFSRGERRQLLDITELEYTIEDLDKEHNTVVFAATAADDTSLLEITIRKVYRFVKSRVEVEYEIANTGMAELNSRFAVEMNLSFSSLQVDSLRLHARRGRTRTEITPDMSVLDAVSDMQYVDLRNNARITLNPADRPDLWSFPVEAVGIWGDRRHWFYQSNCAVFSWPLQLSSGDSRRVSLTLKIEQSK